MLGLRLGDTEVYNVPMIDGRSVRQVHARPARPAAVHAEDQGTVPTGRRTPVTHAGRGQPDNPVAPPADALHFDTAFLNDIAHNAEPDAADPTHNRPRRPSRPRTPITSSPGLARRPGGQVRRRAARRALACGDGRLNENIALTAVHQIFHSEHDRLVDYIDNILRTDTRQRRADQNEWQATASATPATNTGTTELRPAPVPGGAVRDRDGVPASGLRGVRSQDPAGHPAVPRLLAGHEPGHPAEFAHAVYRFGHSMLDDDVVRSNASGPTGQSDNSRPAARRHSSIRRSTSTTARGGAQHRSRRPAQS